MSLMVISCCCRRQSMYCCILRLPHPLRRLYYTTKAYTTQAFSALFAEKSTQKKPACRSFGGKPSHLSPEKSSIVIRQSKIPSSPLPTQKSMLYFPPWKPQHAPGHPPAAASSRPSSTGAAAEKTLRISTHDTSNTPKTYRHHQLRLRPRRSYRLPTTPTPH